MDERGRTYDNIFVERLWRSVKYEDIYLNGYSTMGEMLLRLTKYFDFYNSKRPHQALKTQTQESVYKSASGGGAMIIEKFNKAAPENDASVMAGNQGSAVQRLVKGVYLKLPKNLS